MIIALSVIGSLLTIAIVLFTLWVRGYDLHGKWDMTTRAHECHLPDLYMWRNYNMPDGTVWRCRKCKKGWQKDWRKWIPLKDSLEQELGIK